MRLAATELTTLTAAIAPFDAASITLRAGLLQTRTDDMKARFVDVVLEIDHSSFVEYVCCYKCWSNVGATKTVHLRLLQFQQMCTCIA